MKRSILLFLATALLFPALSSAAYERYVGGESACPGAYNGQASLGAQARTMRCLVNYARKKRGLRATRSQFQLNRSSRSKAHVISECNDFSHTPCGKSFASTFKTAGYMRPSRSWSVGENIAWWGPWTSAAPARIMQAWLNSTGHRQNIFTAKWREQGVAVIRDSSFLGNPNAAIWVSQFGTRR